MTPQGVSLVHSSLTPQFGVTTTPEFLQCSNNKWINFKKLMWLQKRSFEEAFRWLVVKKNKIFIDTASLVIVHLITYLITLFYRVSTKCKHIIRNYHHSTSDVDNWLLYHSTCKWYNDHMNHLGYIYTPMCCSDQTNTAMNLMISKQHDARSEVHLIFINTM